MNKIDNRLVYGDTYIELDGTQYYIPLDIMTAKEWHNLVSALLEDVSIAQLEAILETSEALEGGTIEPDMITENIAMGSDYINITPISDEVLYIEHVNIYGVVVAYQISNVFAIDMLLIWLGTFPKHLLHVALTYVESINPHYTPGFTLK